MIDSINFRINNIKNVDVKKLIDLDIVYHKFKYKVGRFGKPQMVYGKAIENEKNIISTGIEFEYQNVFFQYYDRFNYVLVIANAHKVLGKTDIKLSDRDNYIITIKKTIKKIFDIEDYRLNIDRIDYCVDLEMTKEEIIERIKLLYKHRNEYCKTIRINDYETSIYLTSKNGQRRINIYDKYECEKQKYFNKYYKENERTGISLAEYKRNHIAYYEYYSDVFRIEVQNTRKLLQNESMTILKKYNKVDKTGVIFRNYDYKLPTNPRIANKMTLNINGYWNIDSMNEYFFDFLGKYLYKGRYYKLKEAKKLIKKSTEYTDRQKEELIEFISAVNKFGISDVIETENKNKHKLWNSATIYKYMQDLKEMGINIYFADSNKDFDLKSAKEIIDKSDHTNDWKSRLYEFLKSVKLYGRDNLKITNNKQLTYNSETSRHRYWKKNLVKKYIEMLERLGINPVTLDNDSNFESLESLYVLAKEKAQKVYFDIASQDIPFPQLAPTSNVAIIRERNKSYF